MKSRDGAVSSPPTDSLFADVVAVPKSLISAWAKELGPLEFAVSLRMIGETWLVRRTAAPLPFDDLACWWESLKRPVSIEEIRGVVTRLLQLGILIPVSPETSRSLPCEPLYAVNRDWASSPARY